jgi:hypothetical protein
MKLSPDKPTVYRVNWLRAKARYDWWSEEHILIPNEMNWTRLFSSTKQMSGPGLRNLVPDKPGHVCFAEGANQYVERTCLSGYQSIY